VHEQLTLPLACTRVCVRVDQASLGAGRDPTYEYLMRIKACMLGPNTTGACPPFLCVCGCMA
jgi:hypothetical protein